jgi:hypothetical protein
MLDDAEYPWCCDRSQPYPRRGDRVLQRRRHDPGLNSLGGRTANQGGRTGNRIPPSGKPQRTATEARYQRLRTGVQGSPARCGLSGAGKISASPMLMSCSGSSQTGDFAVPFRAAGWSSDFPLRLRDFGLSLVNPSQEQNLENIIRPWILCPTANVPVSLISLDLRRKFCDDLVVADEGVHLFHGRSSECGSSRPFAS